MRPKKIKKIDPKKIDYSEYNKTIRENYYCFDHEIADVRKKLEKGELSPEQRKILKNKLAELEFRVKKYNKNFSQMAIR